MDQRPFRSKGNLNHFHVNTSKLTNTKAAILQVPVAFSGEEIQIVESDVRLPLHYTPAVGSFMTDSLAPDHSLARSSSGSWKGSVAAIKGEDQAKGPSASVVGPLAGIESVRPPAR